MALILFAIRLFEMLALGTLSDMLPTILAAVNVFVILALFAITKLPIRLFDALTLPFVM